MPKFLIQAHHTLEECPRLLDSILRAGVHYLTNTDWGCRDGVHTAWIIVEAQDHDEARLMIPPVLRNQALLVRLNKFTPDEVKAIHKQAGGQ